MAKSCVHNKPIKMLLNVATSCAKRDYATHIESCGSGLTERVHVRFTCSS